MKKLLFSLCLLLLSFSAQAGMTWTAVAVPYEQLPYLRGNEELLTETLNSEDGLHLDKAWGGLHYLLKANPRNATLARLLFFGGENIGPDQGAGPARVLTPAQVRQIAAMLERETPAALAARYAPQAMEAEHVYPEGIWEQEGQGALVYLLNFYEELLVFVKQADRKGQAMVVVLW
ncbi:protein of unknown function [Duganella sacchari]|uniref:DUF1877 family protein n=1 Tax=Duganella sacchari TaxID=551987 RepID=A0A1M7QK01_9BURK|nr:YfbM family protein [Duganella sacchari]SHN31604.1 protein of unknown function [Duganella sacchari]